MEDALTTYGELTIVESPCKEWLSAVKRGPKKGLCLRTLWRGKYI